MSEPTKRQAHTAKAIENAKQAFSKHEIMRRSSLDNLGRWTLRRPDASWGWCEIVELEGGHLLVHGDIKHTLFNLYTTSGQQPGSLVYWMGQRTAPCSYLREKLARHKGDPKPGLVWDADIALEDMQTYLAGDDYGEPASEELREALEDALGNGRIYDMAPDEVRRVWNDAGLDCETWSDWGMALCYDTALAWAALRRLVDLLESEKSAEMP